MTERDKALLTEVSGWLCERPVETDRLRLRLFRETDFPDYFAWAVQPEQQRLSGSEIVRTEAEARAVFNSFFPKDHPPLQFAVALRDSDRVIGSFSVGFYPFLETREDVLGRRGVSLSFVLNEECQRRGYMTELLSRMLVFFLRERDLKFVNCGHFTFNEGSKRLMEKVGMRHWFDHVYPRGNIPTREMIAWREEWNG